MSLFLLFSFLSFLFFSFLFFILFFLLLEKVSKSTRLFTVDETNLFSLFLSFSIYIYIYIYIYNFQYLGRVEEKKSFKMYLSFRRVYFFCSFLLGTRDISPESAGSASLQTTVQRFCSMLFTGHSPIAVVNRRLYPSTSVLKTKGSFCGRASPEFWLQFSTSLHADCCPKTKDPFPNFI